MKERILNQFILWLVLQNTLQGTLRGFVKSVSVSCFLYQNRMLGNDPLGTKNQNIIIIPVKTSCLNFHECHDLQKPSQPALCLGGSEKGEAGTEDWQQCDYPKMLSNGTQTAS